MTLVLVAMRRGEAGTVVRDGEHPDQRNAPAMPASANCRDRACDDARLRVIADWRRDRSFTGGANITETFEHGHAKEGPI